MYYIVLTLMIQHISIISLLVWFELSCVLDRDSELSLSSNMPIAIAETDAADMRYFLVAIIIDGIYHLIGYSGTFNISDLAYDIMGLANGHMVALPGASDNCFFIRTKAAWIDCELFKPYIVSCSS